MKNKHLPLIIGISLPVIFILVISAVIFTPSLFVKPQHDFIYSTDDSYYGYNQGYKNTYAVENNHIILQALPIQSNQTITPKGDAPVIYLYDVKNNSSHQITLSEAGKYSIDPGPSSPDGYTVNYHYNNDGIFELFGSSRSNNGYYIEKNNGKKQLTGLAGGERNYYQGSFKLIGWVK